MPPEFTGGILFYGNGGAGGGGGGPFGCGGGFGSLMFRLPT